MMPLIEKRALAPLIDETSNITALLFPLPVPPRARDPPWPPTVFSSSSSASSCPLRLVRSLVVRLQICPDVTAGYSSRRPWPPGRGPSRIITQKRAGFVCRPIRCGNPLSRVPQSRGARPRRWWWWWWEEGQIFPFSYQPPPHL